MRTHRLALLLALVSLGASARLAGQADAARDSTPQRRSVPVLGLWFVAGTIASSSVDGGWERTIRGASPQSSSGLREAARFGNAWGSPGAIVAAGALWLGGRALDDTLRARLGGRALEALVVSGIVTGGLKGLTGRARPFAAPGNPERWAFGRGIRNNGYQSFPSGHATAAFAFASAITAQLHSDRSRLARWAGPVLYSLAAVTAFARTYDNAHWLSDAAAGAAVGTLSGLAVVRWNDAHRANWIDRLLLGR